jgi:hypothetical protein
MLTNKLKTLTITFLILFISLFITIIYLKSKDNHFEKKYQLTKSVGLPDLSISTEANFIRHRSLATIFDIYKDDADIRVYFPSSFSINQGLKR